MKQCIHVHLGPLTSWHTCLRCLGKPHLVSLILWRFLSLLLADLPGTLPDILINHCQQQQCYARHQWKLRQHPVASISWRVFKDQLFRWARLSSSEPASLLAVPRVWVCASLQTHTEDAALKVCSYSTQVKLSSIKCASSFLIPTCVPPAQAKSLDQIESKGIFYSPNKGGYM